MTVKPRYYYNLIGNIANEKEEFGTRLMHKEDLNEPFMDDTEKGSDSLLDLLNKYDKENEQLKEALKNSVKQIRKDTNTIFELEEKIKELKGDVE